MQIWYAVFFFVILMLVTLSHIGWPQNRQRRQGFSRRPIHELLVPTLPTNFTRKKPEWVMLEVLRLKALMGKNAGCRKVADTFNRLHATTASVGKSFVSDTIKNHQYALMNISRQLRENRPKPVHVNGVWGVDLTFVRDHHGVQRTVLGPSTTDPAFARNL